MRDPLPEEKGITRNYYEFGKTLIERLQLMRRQRNEIESRAHLYHIAPLHEDIMADFDAFEKRCLAKAEHFIELEETVNGG